MGISLNIASDNIDDIVRQLEQMAPAARRALVRTVRRVTQSAGTQAARDIAKRSRIPVKALTVGGASGRGKRIFTRVPPPGDPRGDRATDPSASIWVGYNPMQSAYIGALRQLKRGARAGRHYFEGSFLATMQSGHRGVFYRTDDSRLPIEEEAVPITVSEDVMRKIEQQARSRLRSVLISELNYELNVRGR